MALGDIFKKSEKLEKKEKPAKKSGQVAKSVKKPSASSNSEAPAALKSIYISEKAGDLNKEDKYVFLVFNATNKREVKKAVETIYKVNVEAVNMIKMPGKSKRMGRHVGRPRPYKKALVQLKKGQKIDIV